MFQKYWVGLDAGHFETAVCLIDEFGAPFFEGMRETNARQVRDILRRFGIENVQLITIEAGVGTQMARQLVSWGLPVQVAEVRRASKFLAIRRDKTDRNDAKGLADLGRLGRAINTGVYLKPPDCQNIRSQLSIRRALVRQKVKLNAVARSIVRLHGGELHTRHTAANQLQAIVDQSDLFQPNGLEVSVGLQTLLGLSEAMRRHIAELDAQMKEAAVAHPVCGRLMSVPGVGPITSLSFYSAIGDPFRFERNEDVGPYLGLTPRLRASGLRAYSGRISRFGNKMTRSHLISAALSHLHAKRCPSPLQAWGLKLADRIGLPKARVAVARKLAVVLLSMWKSGETFRTEVLNSASP